MQLPVPFGDAHRAVAQRAPIDLGLIQPEFTDIVNLVKARQRWVQGLAKGSADPAAFLMKHDILGYESYCGAIAKFDQLKREFVKNGQLAVNDSYALRRLLRMPNKPAAYDESLVGWVAYLADLHPRFLPEIEALAKRSAFPEERRDEHTLIVAPTNWGKSELLKSLAFHHIHRADCAVVVLDPGGDLVKQMARWPELACDTRLIHIEPELRPGFAVGLNPLDGRGLDERGRNHVAAQLATAIGEIAADLSPNMMTLARHCVTVLLSVPDATLFDFVRLLRPVAKPARNAAKPVVTDARAEMLRAAARGYPRATVADFFVHEFDGEYYESTRNALRARLNAFLSLVDVEAMINGQASVHLETVIDERRVILVNLARFGREASALVGRLLVAMIAGIGRRRADLPAGAPRVPVHLFVDETTTMVSDEMVATLAELRKFGIHLTLAQQVGGAGFSTEQRTVLFKNTGVKFLAPTDAEFFRLAGVSSDVAKTLPKIAARQFWVQWGHSAPLARLQVRSDLAGFAHGIDDATWEQCVDYQVATWYRAAQPVATTRIAPLSLEL